MNKPLAEEQRKLGYVTPAEAAKMFRIPVQTVYAWMHKGLLSSKRIGVRRYYISLASLRKMVSETNFVELR